MLEENKTGQLRYLCLGGQGGLLGAGGIWAET